METYAELQSAIAAWLIRDDLTDQIPTFITLAESRFNRKLRTPEMENVVTGTISDGTVTLPTDFLQARSCRLEDGTTLEQMDLAGLTWKYGTLTGTPAHFALQGASQMLFGPTPSAETDLILNYYQKIPALSDSNTTNWLLTAHPDLYLAASLFEGFMLLRDFQEMQAWEARTSAMLNEINETGRRKATSGPLRRRAPTVA